jgi:hypothetical protein
VKTARLSFIFNQANLARLSKTNLSNELLMSALGVICLVDVLLLAVWSGAGPLTADSVTSACSSSIETPLTAALLAYKGILIVSSLVYVYRCRDIPSSFNETAHLSVCFYNLSFVGWLLVVVILALGGSIADSTQSSIKAFGLIYVAITTSCILLVPKFNAFRKAEAAFATAGNSSIANGSMLASGIGGLSSSLDHSNKSYTLTGEEQKHRRAPSFHATDPNSAGQVEQANMILRQQMLDHARLGALSQQIKTESTRLARLKDDVCKLQLQLLKQQTELNFLEQTHGVRPQYSVVEKSVQAEQAHSNSPTVARGSIAARSPGKSTVSGLGASSQSSLRYHSGGGRTIAPAFPMTPHPNSTRASVSSQTTIASPSAVSAGGSTLATTTTPPTDVSPIVLEEIHVAAAITFSAAAAAQCSPPEEGLRSPLRIHLSSNSKHAGVFQPTARSPSSAQRSVEMV